MTTNLKKLASLILTSVFFIPLLVMAQEQQLDVFYSTDNGKVIDENNKLKVTLHLNQIPDSLTAMKKAQNFKQYEGVKKVEFKGFEGDKAKFVFTLTSFAGDKFIQ